MKIKTLFTFILGGLVGAGACYYFLNDKLKKEYEIKLTEEMLNYKNDLNNDISEDERENNDNCDVDETNEKELTKEPHKKIIPKINWDSRNEDDRKVDTHMTNYESMSKSYIDDIEDVEFKEDKSNIPPYIITEEEHIQERFVYDLVYLVFHEEDGALTDEEGEIIDEVDEYIGLENVKKMIREKPDEVYIRNEYHGLDYCVTYFQG